MMTIDDLFGSDATLGLSVPGFGDTPIYVRADGGLLEVYGVQRRVIMTTAGEHTVIVLESAGGPAAEVTEG